MRYPINPVPKPRMTQSDRWKKRPPVMRYWEFVKQVQLLKVKLPEEGAKVTFYLPIPKSWSKTSKWAALGNPHQQRPDLSNLIKALEDAVYGDDAHIWHYAEIKKVWAIEGAIEIEVPDLGDGDEEGHPAWGKPDGGDGKQHIKN